MYSLIFRPRFLFNILSPGIAARIKSDQSKVRKTEGYALYYIRKGGTHNVETNEAAQPTV